MQTLPADAVMPIDRVGAAPSDAMADARDAPKLFGIEVQQFAQVRPLVAHDRCRQVERREPIEAKPAQNLGHCRVRHAELPRDRGRSHALPPQPFDVGDPLRGVACMRAGLELRSRSAISPPTCQRRTHLRTVCSLTQKSAATLTTLSPARTRRAIRSRLQGAVCAFLWMFIRGLGSGC
jgi:hypothetical protein